MKLKKILSVVVAAAITSTMFISTAVSAGAKEITERKVLVIRTENPEMDWYKGDDTVDYFTDIFVGILNENGDLYTYDKDMKATLLSKNVEWANGYYFLKKGKLYNISNKKTALKNVTNVYGHVAATKDGVYYYIGDKKPAKIKTPKKIWDVGFNGDGNVMLFTSAANWEGDGWYWVSTDGYSEYYTNLTFVEEVKHVAKADNGSIYYLGEYGPVKIEGINVKIHSMYANGDGWVLLYTNEKENEGDGWYFVTPDGQVGYYDNTKTSDNIEWFN